MAKKLISIWRPRKRNQGEVGEREGVRFGSNCW